MLYLFLALISGALIYWLFTAQRNDMIKRAHWRESGQEQPEEEAEPLEAPMNPQDIDYSEVNRVYRTADMHFTRGDLEEAEKWFIKVISLNEFHTEALNKLGVIYIQQENARRAEIIYQKLFQISQKEPAYFANYGRCLYSLGRLDEAIQAYEEALQLDPTKPSRLVSLGQIHYELQKYPEALAYFEKALEIEPYNLEYLALTADMAELAGNKDRLIRSLRKITEIEPYNEEARRRLKEAMKKESRG